MEVLGFDGATLNTTQNQCSEEGGSQRTKELLS